MHVVNIVKNGNRIAYYECVDNQGRQGRLTKEQLIAEIEAGRCDNAKLQVYDCSKIVRISKNSPASTKQVSGKSVKTQVSNQQQPQKKVQNYHNYNASIAAANRPKSVVVGKQANDILLHMETGTPLKVKASNYSGFQQVIFMGIKDLQSREAFVFFNDEGFSGSFALSSKFIENNTETVQFIFDDNDPMEVGRLVGIIRSRGGK